MTIESESNLMKAYLRLPVLHPGGHHLHGQQRAGQTGPTARQGTPSPSIKKKYFKRTTTFQVVFGFKSRNNGFFVVTVFPRSRPLGSATFQAGLLLLLQFSLRVPQSSQINSICWTWSLLYHCKRVDKGKQAPKTLVLIVLILWASFKLFSSLFSSIALICKSLVRERQGFKMLLYNIEPKIGSQQGILL